MYLVKIINNDIETIINQVSISSEERISGTIKKGINSFDSFTFSIYPNNIGYNLIYPYKTLVTVYNTHANKYEFIGRVLKPTGSMDSDGVISKTFICESELAYLIDSVQVYGEYHDISPYNYLKMILDNHNANVEEYKRFKIGNVTVKDNNNSIYRYLSYDSSWANINEDLIDKLGGELQVRYENNIKYLDYLTEIGKICSTEIRLGKNIQDITNDVDPTNFYTRVVPLGMKLKSQDSEGNEIELEERLTISGVNEGKIYIEDKEAIKEFGIITKYIFYDDEDDADDLYGKGVRYLASQRMLVSNSITALDLSIIELDFDSFEVGNYYPIIHELLDINDLVRVVEKEIVIENPEMSKIVLGDKQKDIKQYQLDIKKQANKTIQLESKINQQATLISNANNSINKTSKALEQVSSEVSSLGNSTNETINKMVESIQLLSETVININQSLVNINDTLESINVSLTETNEKIIALDERLKILEEVK